MQILTKICKICKKEFHNHPCQTSGSRTWINKIYCSASCFGKSITVPRFIKKCLTCNKNIPTREKELMGRNNMYCSNECKYKQMGKIFNGSGNHQWKGNRAGYAALHKRVRKNKGIPSFCSFNKNHDAKRFEWANKSHKYKFDMNDWIPLCPSCHRIYDRNIKRTLY